MVENRIKDGCLDRRYVRNTYTYIGISGHTRKEREYETGMDICRKLKGHCET